MENTDSHCQSIQEYIRGARNLESLAESGVEVRFEDNSITVSGPPGLVVIARPVDVATGYLALRSRFQDLKDWASVLLAASAFVEFDDRFDKDDDAQALLGGIWDAAFGERPSGEVTEAAKRLAAQPIGSGSAG